MNVSIATKPSASPWPDTEVRCCGTHSEVQIPIVYHLVVRPLPVACISIVIQVLLGVVAFHDATSSSKSNCGSRAGDVQYASVTPAARVRAPPDSFRPAAAVSANLVKLIWGAGSVLFASAGCARTAVRSAAIASSTRSVRTMVPSLFADDERGAR